MNGPTRPGRIPLGTPVAAVVNGARQQGIVVSRKGQWIKFRDRDGVEWIVPRTELEQRSPTARD